MPPDGAEPGELSESEIRSQLEKILASAAFARSERSQQFLQFVCDLTLRGEGSRINQYLVGAEVFKRGPGYSTEEDSLVRRQAHLLRQKLDTYYSREGRADSVRIELPVGHYVPTFRRQPSENQPSQSAPPVPVEPAVSPIETPALPAPRNWLPYAAVAAALVIFALGWFAGRRSAPALAPLDLSAAVRAIWGPWLQNPAGLMICLSNPMTAVVKHYPEAGSLLPGHLAVSASQDRSFRDTFNLPAGGNLSLYPSRVNTKVGESIGAGLLGVFFTRASVPVRFTQSRLVTWDDLRTQDSILLGHNEGNPWLDPLLMKYPFRLGPSRARRRAIINTAPAPGEPAEYQVGQLDGQNAPTQEFALVSMLPGLDSRRHLLLINGLNTQATQMATELLTDPDRLAQLLTRLQIAAPSHQGDWNFQVIIKTEVRDKIATTGPDIIALRVL